MKKHYLSFLFCLFACFSLQAQISITADDMASLGIAKGLSSSTNVSDLSAGEPSDEAQVWDFSALEAEENALLLYAPVAGTVAEADFPLAEFSRTASVSELLGLDLEALLADLVGAEQIPPATAYYTTNGEGTVFTQGFNAEINVPGIADLGATTLPADPPDMLMTPLQYGDEHFNDGQFQLTVEVEALPIPITITIDVDRTVTADAHGTVELPESSHEVLRYSEIMDIAVNAVIFDTSFSVQFYKFFAEGEGHPIATIRAVDPGPSGTPEAIEWVGAVPEASLAVSYNSECLDVTFINDSQFLVDYNWDFGDGNTAQGPFPSHSYAEFGEYEVTVSAVDINGEEFSETLMVELNCPLAADFSANVNCINGDTNFINNSSNWASCSWDFGDGNTSEEINPSHTYEQDGDYTVVLSVVGINGETEEISQDVNYTNCALVSAFDFEVICPQVSFSNMSENAESYFWDFGDGNGSAEENPSHTYAVNGTYTVTLSASIDGLSENYSTEVTLDCPVSNEDLNGIGWQAFPNPTDGIFNIKTDQRLEAGSILSVYNMLGAEVLQSRVGDMQDIQIDLSQFASGLYLFEVTNSTSVNLLKGKVLVD